MSENVKTVHLRATCNQLYANKYLKADDPFPFPVPEHVANSLIKNHYAKLDTTYQTRARPRVERKDLSAEADEPTAPVEAVAQTQPAEASEAEAAAETASEDPTTKRGSRRYNRRDLKAEDA